MTDLGFSFAWALDSEEWERAQRVVARHEPDSEYDSALSAVEELFLGTIRFTRQGQVALPVQAPLPQQTAIGLWRENGPPGAESPAGTRLFQGIDLPVAELAWQLATALDRHRFDAASSGSSADYNMMLDALRIRFHKKGGSIQVLSNAQPDQGWMLVVPAFEFFPGVRRFLSEVARAISDRAPALTDWWTFEPLRPYLMMRPIGEATAEDR